MISGTNNLSLDAYGQVHEKFALQIFSYQCDFCVSIIGIVD